MRRWRGTGSGRTSSIRRVGDEASGGAGEKGSGGILHALTLAGTLKPWIVPILGSRKLERLEESIGVVAVDLTTDVLQSIESALSKITAQGDRYPAAMQQTICIGHRSVWRGRWRVPLHWRAKPLLQPEIN